MNKGRLKVSPELFESPEFELLKKYFTVISWDRKATYYDCLCESKLFESVADGEVTPYYDVTFERKQYDSLTIKEIEKYYA